MKTRKKPADIKVGVLYDWGVHLLEYSLQLIDAPVGEVSGFAHEGFWAPKTKWKADANEDEGFRYYENVAAYLTKKAPLVITPEWSRRPIHILDLAARSAKTGKAIPAKYG
ncbi:MAG: hypothetical protein NTV93_06250 [Verrucomicrobia bacterium]|nr:hypothetical protein [Verrucomicrobiota bacterium]